MTASAANSAPSQQQPAAPSICLPIRDILAQKCSMFNFKLPNDRTMYESSLIYCNLCDYSCDLTDKSAIICHYLAKHPDDNIVYSYLWPQMEQNQVTSQYKIKYYLIKAHLKIRTKEPAANMAAIVAPARLLGEQESVDENEGDVDANVSFVANRMLDWVDKAVTEQLQQQQQQQQQEDVQELEEEQEVQEIEMSGEDVYGYETLINGAANQAAQNGALNLTPELEELIKMASCASLYSSQQKLLLSPSGVHYQLENPYLVHLLAINKLENIFRVKQIHDYYGGCFICGKQVDFNIKHYQAHVNSEMTAYVCLHCNYKEFRQDTPAVDAAASASTGKQTSTDASATTATSSDQLSDEEKLLQNHMTCVHNIDFQQILQQHQQLLQQQQPSPDSTGSGVVVIESTPMNDMYLSVQIKSFKYIDDDLLRKDEFRADTCYSCPICCGDNSVYNAAHVNQGMQAVDPASSTAAAAPHQVYTHYENVSFDFLINHFLVAHQFKVIPLFVCAHCNCVRVSLIDCIYHQVRMHFNKRVSVGLCAYNIYDKVNQTSSQSAAAQSSSRSKSSSAAAAAAAAAAAQSNALHSPSAGNASSLVSLAGGNGSGGLATSQPNSVYASGPYFHCICCNETYTHEPEFIRHSFLHHLLDPNVNLNWFKVYLPPQPAAQPEQITLQQIVNALAVADAAPVDGGAASSSQQLPLVYECPLCFKSVQSKDSINRHLLYHAINENFEYEIMCMTCNKQLVPSSNLAECLLHTREFRSHRLSINFHKYVLSTGAANTSISSLDDSLNQAAAVTLPMVACVLCGHESTNLISSMTHILFDHFSYDSSTIRMKRFINAMLAAADPASAVSGKKSRSKKTLDASAHADVVQFFNSPAFPSLTNEIITCLITSATAAAAAASAPAESSSNALVAVGSAASGAKVDSNKPDVFFHDVKCFKCGKFSTKLKSSLFQHMSQTHGFDTKELERLFDAHIQSKLVAIDEQGLVEKFDKQQAEIGARQQALLKQAKEKNDQLVSLQHQQHIEQQQVQAQEHYLLQQQPEPMQITQQTAHVETVPAVSASQQTAASITRSYDSIADSIAAVAAGSGSPPPQSANANASAVVQPTPDTTMTTTSTTTTSATQPRPSKKSKKLEKSIDSAIDQVLSKVFKGEEKGEPMMVDHHHGHHHGGGQHHHGGHHHHGQQQQQQVMITAQPPEAENLFVFKCNLCEPYTTDDATQLLEHYKLKHQVELTIADSSTLLAAAVAAFQTGHTIEMTGAILNTLSSMTDENGLTIISGEEVPVHTTVQYKCTICQAIFYEKQYIVQHLLEAHNFEIDISYFEEIEAQQQEQLQQKIYEQQQEQLLLQQQQQQQLDQQQQLQQAAEQGAVLMEQQQQPQQHHHHHQAGEAATITDETAAMMMMMMNGGTAGAPGASIAAVVVPSGALPPGANIQHLQPAPGQHHIADYRTQAQVNSSSSDIADTIAQVAAAVHSQVYGEQEQADSNHAGKPQAINYTCTYCTFGADKLKKMTDHLKYSHPNREKICMDNVRQQLIRLPNEELPLPPYNTNAAQSTMQAATTGTPVKSTSSLIDNLSSSLINLTSSLANAAVAEANGAAGSGNGSAQKSRPRKGRQSSISSTTKASPGGTAPARTRQLQQPPTIAQLDAAAAAAAALNRAPTILTMDANSQIIIDFNQNDDLHCSHCDYTMNNLNYMRTHIKFKHKGLPITFQNKTTSRYYTIVEWPLTPVPTLTPPGGIPPAGINPLNPHQPPATAQTAMLTQQQAPQQQQQQGHHNHADAAAVHSQHAAAAATDAAAARLTHSDHSQHSIPMDLNSERADAAASVKSADGAKAAEGSSDTPQQHAAAAVGQDALLAEQHTNKMAAHASQSTSIASSSSNQKNLHTSETAAASGVAAVECTTTTNAAVSEVSSAAAVAGGGAAASAAAATISSTLKTPPKQSKASKENQQEATSVSKAAKTPGQTTTAGGISINTNTVNTILKKLGMNVSASSSPLSTLISSIGSGTKTATNSVVNVNLNSFKDVNIDEMTDDDDDEERKFLIKELEKKANSKKNAQANGGGGGASATGAESDSSTSGVVSAGGVKRARSNSTTTRSASAAASATSAETKPAASVVKASPDTKEPVPQLLSQLNITLNCHYCWAQFQLNVSKNMKSLLNPQQQKENGKYMQHLALHLNAPYKCNECSYPITDAKTFLKHKQFYKHDEKTCIMVDNDVATPGTGRRKTLVATRLKQQKLLQQQQEKQQLQQQQQQQTVKIEEATYDRDVFKCSVCFGEGDSVAACMSRTPPTVSSCGASAFSYDKEQVLKHVLIVHLSFLAYKCDTCTQFYAFDEPQTKQHAALVHQCGAGASSQEGTGGAPATSCHFKLIKTEEEINLAINKAQQSIVKIPASSSATTIAPPPTTNKKQAAAAAAAEAKSAHQQLASVTIDAAPKYKCCKCAQVAEPGAAAAGSKAAAPLVLYSYQDALDHVLTEHMVPAQQNKKDKKVSYELELFEQNLEDLVSDAAGANASASASSTGAGNHQSNHVSNGQGAGGGGEGGLLDDDELDENDEEGGELVTDFNYGGCEGDETPACGHAGDDDLNEWNFILSEPPAGAGQGGKSSTSPNMSGNNRRKRLKTGMNTSTSLDQETTASTTTSMAAAAAAGAKLKRFYYKPYLIYKCQLCSRRMNRFDVNHWLHHDQENHYEMYKNARVEGSSAAQPLNPVQVNQQISFVKASNAANSSVAPSLASRTFSSFTEFLSFYESSKDAAADAAAESTEPAASATDEQSTNGGAAEQQQPLFKNINCLVCGLELKCTYVDVLKHFQSEHQLNLFELKLSKNDLELIHTLQMNNQVQINQGVRIRRRCCVRIPPALAAAPQPVTKADLIRREMATLTTIYKEQIVEKQIVSWLNSEQFLRRNFNYNSFVCIICNASKMQILESHYAAQLASSSSLAGKPGQAPASATTTPGTPGALTPARIQQYYTDEMKTVVLTNHVLTHFNEYCYRCMSCKISWPDRTQLLKHAQECSNSQVVRTKTKYKLKANCRQQFKFYLQTYLDYWSHELCLETRALPGSGAGGAEEPSTTTPSVNDDNKLSCNVFIKDIIADKELLLDASSRLSLSSIQLDESRKLVLQEGGTGNGAAAEESNDADMEAVASNDDAAPPTAEATTDEAMAPETAVSEEDNEASSEAVPAEAVSSSEPLLQQSETVTSTINTETTTTTTTNAAAVDETSNEVSMKEESQAQPEPVSTTTTSVAD